VIETCDPHILIEEQRPGYVRYRRDDGHRWEIHGECDKRGDCAIGAVIETPDGPMQIRDHEHLNELAEKLGRNGRIQSPLDVPIAPDAIGCCLDGPLTIVEL
jgi:hypothetical protein